MNAQRVLLASLRADFRPLPQVAQVTVSCEPFASARLSRTRKRGHHEGVSLACRVRMTLPSFDVHQNFDSVLMNRRCNGQKKTVPNRQYTVPLERGRYARTKPETAAR